MIAKLTPDEVLDSIMATSPRPQKVKTLQALNELCKALFDVGPRDFSKASIARLCDAKGIMAGRGLYNRSGEDHCRLLEAWQHLAGPLPPKLISTEKPTQAYVNTIEDPVLRKLVLRDLSELSRVTSELNVLKAQKTLVIDRRPVEISSTRSNDALKGLEDSERRALKKALSPESLKRKGWVVTSLGEVQSETGRTIFEPGFATGLRKLLGEH